MGLIVALVFFASLVAHEFGHSIVARRHGIRVDEITLWLLGGVSKLGADSETAGDEFRMAVIGPMISLGLGVTFAFVAGLAALAGVPDLVVSGVMWLAVTNLLLGDLQFPPRLPARWRSRVPRRSLGAKRRQAARNSDSDEIGQACGTASLPSAWPSSCSADSPVCGWCCSASFVAPAARSEATMVAQRELLADTTVSDLMSADPVTVPEQLTIDDVINGFVLGARHSAYPVVTDLGMPVGLIDLDSIRRVAPTARRRRRRVAAMKPLSSSSSLRRTRR